MITQIGDPIPGENALHGNDDILSEWCNGFEKYIWIRFDVPAQNDLPFLVEDA